MKLTSAVVISLIITFVAAATISSKRFNFANDVMFKEGRIVGGNIAEEGTAPYQVSIQYDKYHMCGGVIIASEWILTAAHCLANKDTENISVLTGTHNIEDGTGVSYLIERFYIHCNYNNPTSHNDIGLLHLSSSIVFNSKTLIIPLPTKPMKNNDDVILTGWGYEEPFGEEPSQLKMVYLKYIGYRECKTAHKNILAVDVGHICTSTQQREGACHGDSGGPLVSNGVLVGLVNWGEPCAKGYPDVHASVYYYLDWIRNIMSGNSKCNLRAGIWV